MSQANYPGLSAQRTTMSRYEAYPTIKGQLTVYFEAVWDEVLVPLGGAHECIHDRRSFLSSQLQADYPCTEYRFQGHFGFGGKMRTRHNLLTTVDYYPENRTDALDARLAQVNAKLAELWARHIEPVLHQVTPAFPR